MKKNPEITRYTREIYKHQAVPEDMKPRYKASVKIATAIAAAEEEITAMLYASHEERDGAYDIELFDLRLKLKHLRYGLLAADADAAAAGAEQEGA